MENTTADMYIVTHSLKLLFSFYFLRIRKFYGTIILGQDIYKYIFYMILIVINESQF